MILFCPLQQAEQYAAFTACGFILALRQTVSAPLPLPGFHCNHNSESSWEILSSLGSISQINECDKTACIRKKKKPLSITHEKAEVKRDVIVFHILAVCVCAVTQVRTDHVSCLVQLCPFGVCHFPPGWTCFWRRGLDLAGPPWLQHTDPGQNPASAPYLDGHTHTNIRHISNQRYPQ